MNVRFVKKSWKIIIVHFFYSCEIIKSFYGTIYTYSVFVLRLSVLTIIIPFQLWSDVASITFTKITSGKADIDISFLRGDHGDSRPFDGPGLVLGHAFPPGLITSRPDLIGNIHLDEEENWTANSRSGLSLHYSFLIF